MSDHRLTTTRPISLYVENGSGTVRVTAHDTTEATVASPAATPTT